MMAYNSGSTSKPELQTIFDSISSKNFNTLRSVLNPLTLHDRRCIVNQKLHGKSTLYHAIECGSKPIVKYLLVDCMANVLQESWNGTASDWPLRKVVEKLDIFMLFVITRYSGSPLGNYKIQETVDYTLKMEYHSVIWFLGLRVIDILKTDRGNAQMEMLRLTNLKGRKSYNVRSEIFLEVTASGNLNKVKLLIASGLDIHLTNDNGENGLSLAILNGREEVIDFLIKNKVYSLRSFACSLELCGAKLIIFNARKRDGTNLWRTSVQIRNTLEHGFADKSNITELGLEFKTESEINQLETWNDGNIYIQALIVFRRLLRVGCQYLIKAFLSLNSHIHVIKPLSSLAILCEMFDMVPIGHWKRPIVERYAGEGFYNLCMYHFLIWHSDREDYVPGFQDLLKLLDPHFWKPLIPRMQTFYIFCISYLMKTLLKYLPLMQSRPPLPGDEYWIRYNLRKIIQADLHPYQSTLFHVAVEGNLPLPVISFLLECGADPNCKDSAGNTPLHLVGSSRQQNTYLQKLTDLLIRAGGHIDTINRNGIRPSETLVQRGLIQQPLRYISLQCLAARAINAHRIFVDEEAYQKSVLEYVKIHSNH